MDALPLQFRTLRFFGVWSETDNDHWFIKYLWRPFNINVLLFFALSQLAALSIYRENVTEFTECLFFNLTYIGLSFKLVNWLFRRNTMLELLQKFRNPICLPRDDQERKIMKKYQKLLTLIFNIGMWSAQLNNLSFAASPIASMLIGTKETFLPFKTYEIYDKNNQVYYWITYLFQIIANDIGIFMNITLDTMLVGFLLLTCTQIDLCCHRFSTVRNEGIRQSVKQCVAHQLLIRRIVRDLENFFMPVVMPLMLLSLITLCTSVYNVSQVDVISVQLLILSTYIVCILLQLGCYCWFANEIKVKSNAIRETMFDSDWIALKVEDKKSLYLIMLSCQREVTLSFHGFCAIDMDIFVWVLKASYSAYNLLKRVE